MRSVSGRETHYQSFSCLCLTQYDNISISIRPCASFISSIKIRCWLIRNLAPSHEISNEIERAFTSNYDLFSLMFQSVFFSLLSTSTIHRFSHCAISSLSTHIPSSTKVITDTEPSGANSPFSSSSSPINPPIAGLPLHQTDNLFIRHKCHSLCQERPNSIVTLKTGKQLHFYSWWRFIAAVTAWDHSMNLSSERTFSRNKSWE